SQLYSLRYGTVPVVHATGGPDDTVGEFDAASGSGTGFKFAPCTPEALRDAVAAAIAARRDVTAWGRPSVRGRRGGFSCARSARASRNRSSELLTAPSGGAVAVSPRTTSRSRRYGWRSGSRT